MIMLLWVGCAGRTDMQEGSRVKLQYDTGVGYLNKGEPQQAVSTLKGALELAPKQPLILHALGLAYMQMGLLDAAIEKLEDAAKYDKTNPDLMNNLSSVYLASGQYEKGIKTATVSIDDPDYRTPAAARFNRGSCYMMLEQYDKAIDDFTVATRLDPLYDLPYQKLGEIALGKGIYDDAVTYFTASLKVNQSNIEALFHRGKAYWNRGLLTDAENDFNTVLRNTSEQNPLNKSAREWLDKID